MTSSPPKLLVQKYLETHTFGQLIEGHAVNVSFSKCARFFSLNYDQISAKDSDPLAQQCRGLILALPDGRPIFGQVMPDGKINRDNMEPGETIVMARPMDRFFNAGMGAAANINWSDPNLKVLNKLDGSCLILWFNYFDNVWEAATRSTPQADIIMNDGKHTFRTLFERAVFDTIGKSFYDFTYDLDKDITYVFELTSPFNRIVVAYNECSITLLAARSLLSHEELDITTLNVQGVPKVGSYPLRNLEDIQNFVASQNPLEYEGVVVLDSNFNRIKVKSPSYVALHKSIDILGSSDRNCMEWILAGKDDDVMVALPPIIQDNLIQLKTSYATWLKDQEALYHVIKSEATAQGPDKKTFALTVNKHKPSFPAIFFQLFDGKASSVRDFVDRAKREGTWSNSFIDKILEGIAPKTV